MRAGRAFKATFVFVTLAVVCAQALAAGFVPAARAQATGPVASPCPALSRPLNRWTRLSTGRADLPYLAAFA
ncbi:MAG: hypothetical protein M3217_04640, partial [Actinomycetota bacterium]|nr:hypothetical protein [Actinomycetota bacterium]